MELCVASRHLVLWKRSSGPWFCLICAALLAALSSRAEVRTAEARNVTVAIYPDDSLESVAVLKVERVYTDHRHVGFFSVKLLPVLVAQGVRLEMTSSTPNTNWLASFHANLLPSARSGSIEWRNCSLWFPHETSSRLEVARLTVNSTAGREFCTLEDVTLQTVSGPLKLPRAKLALNGRPGQVVWQQDGSVVQWDLFSQKLNTVK